MSRKYWQRRNSKQPKGSVRKLFTTDGEVRSSKCQMFCKTNWLNTGRLQACEKWYFCQNTAMSQWKEWSKVLQNNVQKTENVNVYSC